MTTDARQFGPETNVPLRLLMVLPSLGGGGAERAAVDLLRGLNRQQFHVTLAVFAASGRFRTQVPPGVRVVDLQGKPSYDLRLVWRLARVMRQERPQVVLSILRYANLVTLLARRLAHVPAKVIVNEQNLPSAEFALFGGRRVKESALRWLYPQADSVSVISQGIASELIRWAHLPEHRLRVIANPIDLDRVVELGAAPPDHPWFGLDQPVIVGVGRLHPQKGFVYLVRAFARVRREVACKLVILGEGPQRAELEQLADQHGLREDVSLPGFKNNPYSYMAHAATFVLSSVFEGFGNVIVEALAVGTPVIATRCPVGPEEILADGRTGLLVPPADEDALAQAMLRLLRHQELRDELAAAGRLRAQDYALERIVAQYEDLIRTLATGDCRCVS